MTKVINLFGGSGIGKSTLACELFVILKKQQKDVELVREYVKNWAWENIKVGQFDQIYLMGKQAKYESRLYSKVDYIITDSPLLLSPIYEYFYTGQSVVEPTTLKFIEYAKERGIEYHNFIIPRNKPFVEKGRYEKEETARKVDEFVIKKLNEWNINYTLIDTKYEAEFILNLIDKEK